MAKAAPPLNIPLGDAISVKIIDTTSEIGNIPLEYLMGPAWTGFTHTGILPSFSFLLEHSSGRKMLFDLGVRKDFQNFAPTVAKRIAANGWHVKVTKGIVEILEEQGVDPNGIEGMVWR
jgi:hypothetical protein